LVFGAVSIGIVYILSGDIFGMKTSGTEQPPVLVTGMGNNQPGY
jgi:hypothetical protein